MSTIILHDKKNNDWTSLGIGPLSEAINPLATRERNGIYDLSFRYPVGAPLFKELRVGRWIVADAGPTINSRSQRFEIAEISKPIKGIVTVYCEHYRYQLLRSIVKIGSNYNDVPAQTALNQLKERMEPKGDFSFFSDISTRSSIDFSDPSKFTNAQEALGGVRGSMLDNFGGEYIFNNNEVRLLSKAGKESNVIIAYGKNLTDITQEESIENTFTSVYGWAKVGNGDEEKIITLPETYIDSEYVNNYTQRRIQMIDFSDKEPKDVNALRELVKNYIKNNNVGIPKVSIKTSFVDLASSVLGENLENLEMIDLCDWVTVAFNKLEINTSAQIIKTVWNAALDQYESVELGEARTDFSNVLDDSKTDVSHINDKIDFLEKAQEEASNIIKNPGKGHVVVYPSFADPQELLIMDTTNINTAQKVWRWNVGGLGFSSTGYNGKYELAMTNNGAIVADRMTTGTLRAINIIGVAISGSTIDGGTITSTDGSYKTEISGGSIRNYSSGNLFSVYNAGGLRIYDTSGTNLLGSLYRAKGNLTGREDVVLSAYPGSELWLGRWNGNAHDVSICIEGNDGSIGIYEEMTLYRPFDANNQYIKDACFDESFTVMNLVTVDFYSNINMNGYRIINSSDIRLKENIEDTLIDGIAETKKMNFVEFDRKQNYQTKKSDSQPSSERELGLIAQYTPFLSVEGEDDHYLRIDTSKQIMLNSLTNKQLISVIEKQEKRLAKIEKYLSKEEGFDE